MKTQMNRQCLAIAIASSIALSTAGTTVANASELSEHQNLNSQPIKVAVVPVVGTRAVKATTPVRKASRKIKRKKSRHIERKTNRHTGTQKFE